MIPDKINISGIDIGVVFEDLDAQQLAGQYRPDTTEIAISTALSQSKQATVFIHEVIEAINDIYDVNLRHHQIELLAAGFTSSGLIWGKPAPGV